MDLGTLYTATRPQCKLILLGEYHGVPNPAQLDRVFNSLGETHVLIELLPTRIEEASREFRQHPDIYGTYTQGSEDASRLIGHLMHNDSPIGVFLQLAAHGIKIAQEHVVAFDVRTDLDDVFDEACEAGMGITMHYSRRWSSLIRRTIGRWKRKEQYDTWLNMFRRKWQKQLDAYHGHLEIVRLIGECLTALDELPRRSGFFMLDMDVERFGFLIGTLWQAWADLCDRHLLQVIDETIATPGSHHIVVCVGQAHILNILRLLRVKGWNFDDPSAL